jgi:uncharacterized protein YjbI with pentapeptide repeats
MPPISSAATKPAVRLAGIYAMARLADDWTEQRQQCIDVLCAYLRLPYDPDPKSGDLGEREVRYSVIGLIKNHLVPKASPSWQKCSFDFNGAVFDGGDFRRVEFTGGIVDFRGAKFTGGTVDFGRGKFAGTSIVDFRGAKFTGGTVDFRDVEFNGSTVSFRGAKFSRGTVDFRGTEFVGSDLDVHGFEEIIGTVSFSGAKFTGSILSFDRAKFTGATVDFNSARFSGGTVQFNRTEFTGGTVRFRGTEFWGGTVDLTTTIPGPSSSSSLEFEPALSSTYSPRLPSFLVSQL